MNRETNSIEQGNRLIHIWLGKSYETDKKVKELKYHSSWDWLMPVVEKIEGRRVKNDFGFSFQIENWQVVIREVLSGKVLVSILSGVHSKIEAVWKAVVYFIEWYNKEQNVQASVATGGEQGTKS